MIDRFVSVVLYPVAVIWSNNHIRLLCLILNTLKLELNLII